jgi:hypothetical protein
MRDLNDVAWDAVVDHQEDASDILFYVRAATAERDRCHLHSLPLAVALKQYSKSILVPEVIGKCGPIKGISPAVRYCYRG